MKVTPDKLYTGRRIRRFINACQRKGVCWAIFSDLHGVWFPTITHEWYDKDPNSVTEREFRKLVMEFDASLRHYEEIWFYYNPSRFHEIYRKLVSETRLKHRLKLFTHIAEIV